MDDDNIREVEVRKNKNGQYRGVRIVFGPQYVVEIKKKGGKLDFTLVATHHGFKTDASKVNSGLIQIIGSVIKKFPKNVTDWISPTLR
jgi:hypothetical protein